MLKPKKLYAAYEAPVESGRTTSPRHKTATKILHVSHSINALRRQFPNARLTRVTEQKNMARNVHISTTYTPTGKPL